MAESDERPEAGQITYEDMSSATPVVYFDIVAAHGTMNGIVQVELGSRVLAVQSDGQVEIKFISSARLRCSATAAANLRRALDEALKMLEQTQSGSTAGPLN